MVNAFRHRVFQQGMQPQEAFLKAPEKKGLLAGLKAATPDWYDPAALWTTFPASTYRVTPVGVQSISQSPHLTAATLPAVAATTEAACS